MTVYLSLSTIHLRELEYEKTQRLVTEIDVGCKVEVRTGDIKHGPEPT